MHASTPILKMSVSIGFDAELSGKKVFLIF